MEPVKTNLKKFVLVCANDDEYKRKLGNLARVLKSDEWKIVVEILWTIKNDMAIELLQSSKYTKDDISSKDLTQKVYHNISEWIDFLTNPIYWVRRKGMIQNLTQQLKGVKPERKEKK